MSGWTHPMCDPCWAFWSAGPTGQGREPVRLREEFRQDEFCCWCGQQTRSGIYARENPAALPRHGGHE